MKLPPWIILAAISYTQAVTVTSPRIRCGQDQHDRTEALQITPQLDNQISLLCANASSRSIPPEGLQNSFGTIIFAIFSASEGAYVTPKDCSDSFRTILSMCSDRSHRLLTFDKITYSISDSIDPKHQENHIEARRRRVSKNRNTRPTAKRPGSKVKSTKRPTSKRPKSAKHPKKRPTKSRTKSRPTKTSLNKHSATPSQPVKLKPLKTCKQLHVELAREEKQLTLIGGLDRRFSFSDPPRLELVERAGKRKGKNKGKGKASTGSVKNSRPCNAEGFKSNKYEPFSVEIKDNHDLPVFGYKKEDDCANYEWFKGIPGLKKATADSKGKYLYDTEHVLEWNTVAQFFDIFLEKKFKQDQIPNPDPKADDIDTHGTRTQKKQKFCLAWKTAWSDWPQDQHFKLHQDGPSRNPFGHIADVYPSTDPLYKREEFTGLQKSLNQLKLRVSTDRSTGVHPAYNEKFFKWNEKPADIDENWVPVPNQLYNEKMGTRGHPEKGSLGDKVLNDPGAALIRLRNVLGVRMYLNDKKVRGAMRNIKIRLQDRFDAIEAALAKPENARAIQSSGTERQGNYQEPRTLHPWKVLNLGALWDEYMDAKWEMARRHEAFISKWENELRKKYCLAKHRKDTKIDSKDSKEEQHRKQVTADLCPKLKTFTMARKTALSIEFSAPWKGSRRTQRPKDDAKHKDSDTKKRPKHPKKLEKEKSKQEDLEQEEQEDLGKEKEGKGKSEKSEIGTEKESGKKGKEKAV